MSNVPRVRERTATPEELEEDRRRYLDAKAKPPTPAPAQEGNPLSMRTANDNTAVQR